MTLGLWATLLARSCRGYVKGHVSIELRGPLGGLYWRGYGVYLGERLRTCLGGMVGGCVGEGCVVSKMAGVGILGVFLIEPVEEKASVVEKLLGKR
ncbi:unnamed protein product, partial [Dovyalis caffra]